MVHAKNYETVHTFVKVMQKKPWPLFWTRCSSSTLDLVSMQLEGTGTPHVHEDTLLTAMSGVMQMKIRLVYIHPILAEMCYVTTASSIEI